ncbi:MAG: zinc carboxypeptidase, partial [Bacteroidetes bacterium]
AYIGQERRRIADAVPGAIFEVKMDNTHPLAYGLKDTYFSLKTGTASYDFLQSGWNVGRLSEDLRYIGFVGSHAQKRLQNTLVFGVESIGQGQVVYLVDNPLYRGFWAAGTFLMSNAVFMVGAE